MQLSNAKREKQGSRMNKWLEMQPSFTWSTKTFGSTAYGSASKPCTPGEHQNSW